MISTRNHHKQKAFTLVELLVALAIIAILTTIAFPTFTNQVQSTRRTEAVTSLLDYAMKFEEFYSTNFTYEDADKDYGLDDNPMTENAFYQLSATIADDGNSYTISATAINSQASDTDCAAMTIDNVGQKAPTDCW